MTRHCESCGKFVPNSQLKTARYFYDIDRSIPVSVYSLATATVFQQRLDCAVCSMECCRMKEAERGHGIAVGLRWPHGWTKCSPDSTQANVIEVSA